MIIYSNFDDLILIMIIYSNLVLFLNIKIFGCPLLLLFLLSLPRGHVDLTASPTVKIPSQDSESLEEMSLERRMSMGRRKKDRGNFWYSRGEFTQAIQNYRKEEETARWRRRPWNYQSFNFLNFHKINLFTSTSSHLAVSD